MRILVVEDDEVIAGLIRKALEQAGFKVVVVHDGNEGLALALEEEFLVIVLDLMLPGMDGLELCATLRAHRKSRVPVLMLTARDAVDDRVEGLEAGADDYLPKPFDFRELLARIKALIRRNRMDRPRVIQVADLEVDLSSLRVSRGGAEIPLTPREFAMLSLLVQNQGQTVSRELILARVWDDEADPVPGNVNVHIANLRKKVDGEFPVKLIQTVYGEGYVLRSPEETAAL